MKVKRANVVLSGAVLGFVIVNAVWPQIIPVLPMTDMRVDWGEK